MKRFYGIIASLAVICIALVTIAARIQSQHMMIIGQEQGAAGPSYLLSENWNGTTEDNTWTVTDTGTGSYDDDCDVGCDAAAPLEGAQSLWMDADGGGDEVYLTLDSAFSNTSDAWVFLIVHFTTFASGDACPFFKLKTSGGASIAQLRIATTASTTAKNFEIKHGTVGWTASSTTIAVGTKYYVWVHYVKDSGGTDGVLDVWFSTDTTRNGGDITASIANGDSSNDVGKTSWAVENNHTFITDKLRVDDVEIGNNPS